jgi:hypothetical protein
MFINYSKLSLPLGLLRGEQKIITEPDDML